MTQDIERSLRKLQQQFAGSLAERFDAVEAALAQWRSEPEAVHHIDALHLLAHGLSGSGAIFGFTALSAAAAELETSLDALRQQQRDITPETVRTIEVLWAQVRQAGMTRDSEKNV